MKRLVSLFCLFAILSGSKAFAWGFWAHQRINRMAVFTLPPEMLKFYKKNIDYVTQHATDPDMRRYAVDGEAECHFIDLDRYGKTPYPELPRFWKAAIEKYGEDSLRKHGIVPYHIPEVMKKLTAAFKAKDVSRILKYSSDLGHYVGDAHVPLHTCSNYNGQKTGQKGIHGFWESRLPELFAENYNFYIGRGEYVEDVLMEPWAAVMESNNALDSVLTFEKKLSEKFPEDQKYGYESRNNLTIRTYSREYAEAYHELLDGMVERRMRAAIYRVGCFWLTAWKDAGSPDLSELIDLAPEEIKESQERKLQIQDRENGDIGYRRHKAGSHYYFHVVAERGQFEC